MPSWIGLFCRIPKGHRGDTITLYTASAHVSISVWDIIVWCRYEHSSHQEWPVPIFKWRPKVAALSSPPPLGIGRCLSNPQLRCDFHSRCQACTFPLETDTQQHLHTRFTSLKILKPPKDLTWGWANAAKVSAEFRGVQCSYQQLRVETSLAVVAADACEVAAAGLLPQEGSSGKLSMFSQSGRKRSCTLGSTLPKHAKTRFEHSWSAGKKTSQQWLILNVHGRLHYVYFTIYLHNINIYTHVTCSLSHACL